jgi:hypothetical protein
MGQKPLEEGRSTGRFRRGSRRTNIKIMLTLKGKATAVHRAYVTVGSTLYPRRKEIKGRGADVARGGTTNRAALARTEVTRGQWKTVMLRYRHTNRTVITVTSSVTPELKAVF